MTNDLFGIAGSGYMSSTEIKHITRLVSEIFSLKDGDIDTYREPCRLTIRNPR